jgi:hypothetical protein
MENEGKFSRAWRSFTDKIQDQVWFQQLKAKWDELDHRSKSILRYGSLIGGVALVIGLVGTTMMSVAATKGEIDRKLSLIRKIQSSQDELRRLKDITSRFSGGGEEPWAQFLQQKALAAGLDPAGVQVASEKVVETKSAPAPKGKDGKPAPAAPANGPEETVIEVGLKKINVRQLAKYVHEIENGGRTVKVRRLVVDTAPDESGYLDMSVTVSAFKMKEE